MAFSQSWPDLCPASLTWKNKGHEISCNSIKIPLGRRNCQELSEGVLHDSNKLHRRQMAQAIPTNCQGLFEEVLQGIFLFSMSVPWAGQKNRVCPGQAQKMRFCPRQAKNTRVPWARNKDEVALDRLKHTRVPWAGKKARVYPGRAQKRRVCPGQATNTRV